MNLKNITNKIQDLLLAQLFTFSLVYALTSSLCLTYSVYKTLLISCLCIIILFLLFFNKKTTIAACIIIGIAVIASILYVIFVVGIQKSGIFVNDYFYWLELQIEYPEPGKPLFEFITVVSLCVALSVFTFIFTIKKFKFLIILSFGMILFAVQWSYNIISSMAPFYLFLAGAIIAYLKHIYQSKSSDGSHEYARPLTFAAWSVPVSILVILLAYSIRANDKPIEWEWLDNKIVSAYNYIKRNFDYETFDYFSLSASSGFGDKNNFLGGRVRLDKTNVLYVTTNKRIYLKGASKDIYTGNSWINSVDELELTGSDYSCIYSDYNEMINGMKLLTDNEQLLEEYSKAYPVTVSYLNIRTKSVFLPGIVNKFIPYADSFSGFISNTGEYSSGRRLTKGFSYEVNMISPDIGTEEFADIMRKSKKGLYSEKLQKILFYTSKKIVDEDGNDIDFETYKALSELEQRSREIYDKYLELPENLPQRVKDLSASLVASIDNNYDKAKAIEQYLAVNYPYNLDVRSTPRNRDFVDYFLFDQKEGYCSYYASAMAILARCAGLPARYVEGYMLPPEPFNDSDNTFVITNMQAHAWVEVYFEGYGWLPFEPTSPFRSRFYTDNVAGVYLASDYDSVYQDYMEMMELYANQYSGFTYSHDFTRQEEVSATLITILVISCTILLIALILLFNIIKSRYRLYKLSSLPAKESILGFYDYYVKILGLIGLGLLPSETPFQYSVRIDSQMFFNPIKLKTITEVFVRARYSLEEASENEKQLLCDFQPLFLKEVKKHMGDFKYFIHKYLFNKL